VTAVSRTTPLANDIPVAASIAYRVDSSRASPWCIEVLCCVVKMQLVMFGLQSVQSVECISKTKTDVLIAIVLR